MEDESDIRRRIVAASRAMADSGLNCGTSGNVSVRHGEAALVTPSAVPPHQLEPEMIARMPLDGGGVWEGPRKPTSEWRFHLDILNARPATGAVVHAHPTHCTALAMLRRDIPAAHYMVAAFGGNSVRCAGYATFGTAELSRLALAALKDRSACLLANHGAIALGSDLAQTMWRMEELEALAGQYVAALSVGEPAILSDGEIAETLEKFAGYGLNDGAA